MKNRLMNLSLLIVVSVLVVSGCAPATGSISPLPTPQTGGQPSQPSDPAGARDAVLAYLAEDYAGQTPAPDLAWTEKRTTPQGLVGSESYEYTAGDWVITVSYPVAAPENVVYTIVVANQATGFQWEGQVDAAGQVTESTSEGTPAPGGGQADVPGLVIGNTAFAFDLYQALKGQSGNLFFSPYSISQALAMTYAGVRGETEQQMAEVLHFALPQAGLHPSFKSLDQELAQRPQGQDARGFRLSVANALWAQEGYQFLPDFVDLLSKNYGAGLQLVNYISAAEQARTTINDWVSQQTEGKIRDLIPAGVLDNLTRLVLTNAIYFNAAWATPFEKSMTQDGMFTRLDGSQVQVPMMRQTGSLGYAEVNGYQVVELPYDGGELSMVILLPAQGEFAALEDSLDAAQVETILQELAPEQVALTMPRFKFDSQFSLKDALSQMGMPLAFTPDADLSGMTGNRELHISAVLHKAFVSVDEAGTEAAAATAVVVGVESMPSITAEATVDRPFLFLIRDLQTGTLLFLGRVVDPGR